MQGLPIGELARRTGLTASAIRYYEKAGLVPAPSRQSRQRRYDAAILGRIEIIKVALAAGFTIAETRVFLSGFSSDVPPAARWRALAARKLQELDALMQRAQRMKRLLESSFHCRCMSLAECERLIRRTCQRRDAP